MMSNRISLLIILVLSLFFTFHKVKAQPSGTLYIDPNYSPSDPSTYVPQGTYWAPYLSLLDVPWVDGYIYEIAHNTTMEIDTPIYIGADNVNIFWAMGWIRPTITTAPNVELPFLLHTNGYNGITFWEIDFDGTNTQSTIYVDETQAGGACDLLFNYCGFMGMQYGIRAIGAPNSFGQGIEINHCTFQGFSPMPNCSSCNTIGVFAENFNQISVSYCSFTGLDRGIDLTRGSDFTLYYSTVQTSFSDSSASAYLEGYETITIGSCDLLDAENGIHARNSSNFTIYDNEISNIDSIAIFIEGDPNSFGTSLQIVQCHLHNLGYSGIWVSHTHNIELTNSYVFNSSQAISIKGDSVGSILAQPITISNCEINNIWGDEWFVSQWFDDFTMEDCNVHGVSGRFCQEGLINVTESKNEILGCTFDTVSAFEIVGVDNTVFSSNTLKMLDCEITANSLTNQVGLLLKDGDSCIVSYNEFQCDTASVDGVCVWLSNAPSSELAHNTMLTSPSGNSCLLLDASHNTKVYNNFMEYSENGIKILSDSVILHHNIIKNSSLYGIHAGINAQVEFYHNNIYAENNTANYTALFIETQCANCTSIVKNNIFCIENQLGKLYDLGNATQIETDYNFCNHQFPFFIKVGNMDFHTFDDGDPSSSPTTTEYHITGNGLHSVYSSSVHPFTDAPNNNFNLVENAACIDSGTYLEGYNVDFGSFYIPAGVYNDTTKTDMGAFEYYGVESQNWAQNNPSGWYFATDGICEANPKIKKGNIYHNNELVYIRGVNYYALGKYKNEGNNPNTGATTSFLELDEYGFSNLLHTIIGKGYNSIRLCFTADVILDQINGSSAPVAFIDSSLAGNTIFFDSLLTPLSKYEALQAMVNECEQNDINVLLCQLGIEQSSKHVWYDDQLQFSETDFLETLFYLAQNITNDNVIGIDLINEPQAKWDGSNDRNDFRRFVHVAGIGIRSINPDWMVFVEGVQNHGIAAKEIEEANAFKYTSNYLSDYFYTPTTNWVYSNNGYGENLSAFGENNPLGSAYQYAVDEDLIAYHKLVFSPHVYQFTQAVAIDSFAYTGNPADYDQSKLTELNNYRWGYLRHQHAVVPGEFAQIEYPNDCISPNCALSPNAEYSVEWFDYFIKYMAESKLPGSFYWAINGNTTVNAGGIEYETGLIDDDWISIKESKNDAYAVMFGRVETTFVDTLSDLELYSPRDGTRYTFPVGCLDQGDVIEHTAHWAGSGHGNQYAHDVLSAINDYGNLHDILHAFKVSKNGSLTDTTASPFEIEINYTDDELGYVCENSLDVYQYNPLVGTWEQCSNSNLNCVVNHNPSNNSFSIATNELGIYALLGTDMAQGIELSEGWNLWSTYMVPNDTSLELLLKSIADTSDLDNSTLMIMKNGVGEVFWPLFGLNSIGNLDFKDGYHSKLKQDHILRIKGVVAIPEQNPVLIPAGWSMISYLRKTEGLIDSMLNSIDINLVSIVKNGIGQVFWPAYNLNEIGNMKPGHGYQIKILGGVAQTLSYPPNDTLSQSSTKQLFQDRTYYKHYVEPIDVVTCNNMVVGIPVAAWDLPLVLGDEIVARGEQGQVVGKTVFNGGFTAIILYGDDQYTSDCIENLSDGERFTFEVWHQKNNVTSFHVFDNWQTFDGTFQNNRVDVVMIDQEELESQGIEIYPNPSDGRYVLEIYSIGKQFVKLSLFDLNGRQVYADRVSVLKGQQRIELDLSFLKNGVYSLFVEANHITHRQKLILMN